MNDDKDMEITLPILQSIEQESSVTQRTLAKQLGLALGLTNSYLKRCINKGLVKIEQVPANRYLYYLTPQGFAEKSRLMGEYLSHSFQFYRTASDSCLRTFEYCQQQGWNAVILCGISELAEIALLQATRSGIQVTAVFDSLTDRNDFLQRPVCHDLSDLPKHSVCLVTSLQKPLRTRQELERAAGEHHVLVPDILGL